MLNRLLKLLGDDAEIDDELYQKIFDNMLERLKDKVAEIRAQAVTALQRLQVTLVSFHEYYLQLRKLMQMSKLTFYNKSITL